MRLGLLALIGFLMLAFAMAQGDVNGIALIIAVVSLTIAYVLALADGAHHSGNGGDGQ